MDERLRQGRGSGWAMSVFAWAEASGVAPLEFVDDIS